MSADMDVIREEIAGEQRAYRQSEWAPLEGRVVDEQRHALRQLERLDRIAVLEAEYEVARAFEEAAAEIRESCDPGYES